MLYLVLLEASIRLRQEVVSDIVSVY